MFVKHRLRLQVSLKSGKNNRRSEAGLRESTEEASIAPLISIYFSLLMICIFIVSNMATTYVARRELINVVEGALAKAAQELDEMKYYYKISSPSIVGSMSNDSIPLDCQEASLAFSEEVRSNSLQGGHQAIVITSFDCDGSVLRARVSRVHDFPFTFPMIPLRQFTNRVDVAITTRYL